jgi:D-alanyl-D-alanine carboxypeptidase (penicillin-binding protein 5/6)
MGMLSKDYLKILKRLFVSAGLLGLLGGLVGKAPDFEASAQASNAKPIAATARTTHRVSISRNPYLGAIVVDAATGRVLFEDQADAKGYPASVLKLMDLLIILERIESKQLSLQDQVPVSAKVAKTGGSQVWLAEKESFTVDEMLYALMVQSANDAAVALAEKVSGTSEGFVALMNQRAKALGMTSTIFHSVHGLPPAPGQDHDVTTARDLSLLCRELLKHPDTLRYTATRDHSFRPNVPAKSVLMHTHNHLLGHLEGCDGLKTGYIAQAGYSIAVTAARNGHRLVVVVLDSVDLKTRDSKARDLVARGFDMLGSQTSAVPAAKVARIPAK